MAKLFSAYSLADESVSTISIDNKYSYSDDSYFMESLDFLSGIRKEYTVASAKLYRRISESSTDRIAIREGFSDFFGAIKSFIKKIIDFIKKLLKKFWVRMNSLFLRDKYIEKHKNELSAFSAKHEFDINGFKYTFSDNVPSTDALTDIDSAIGSFTNTGKSAKSYVELKKAYESFKSTRDSNSYLDDTRRSIIKSSSTIDESDYASELFKVFRDGESSKSKMTVTSEIVMEALAFFSGYEKLKNQTQRYSDNVEKIYREIQKKLEKIQTSKVNGIDQVDIEDFVDNTNDVSADKIAIYDMFTKLKCQEVQEISNLHVMAFSAKLDAIKEDFTQSKGIIYGAFKKILAKTEAIDIASYPEVLDAAYIMEMTAKQRKALPASEFGIPKKRKFPMPDAKHVEFAIDLFGHAEESDKKELAANIIKFADKYNVDIPENSEVMKYANGGKK